MIVRNSLLAIIYLPLRVRFEKCFLRLQNAIKCFHLLFKIVQSTFSISALKFFHDVFACFIKNFTCFISSWKMKEKPRSTIWCNQRIRSRFLFSFVSTIEGPKLIFDECAQLHENYFCRLFFRVWREIVPNDNQVGPSRRKSFVSLQSYSRWSEKTVACRQ